MINQPPVSLRDRIALRRPKLDVEEVEQDVTEFGSPAGLLILLVVVGSLPVVWKIIPTLVAHIAPYVPAF